MKRLPFAIVAAVLAFSLSACGKQSAQPPANQPATQPPPATSTTPPSTTAPSTTAPSTTAPSGATANAESIFKNTCAACHGQTLEGVVGPNLQHVGGKYTKEQILDILKNGKGGMPPGLVKGGDADAIATWLAAKK